MPQSHLLAGNGQMAKAVHFVRIRPALGSILLQVVQVRPATAREKERGGVSLELQVLQIVVMTGEKQVHVVLAE
jgi:hypothetical protein